MSDINANMETSSVTNARSGSLVGSNGTGLSRVQNFINQPAIKRSLPLVGSIIFAVIVLIIFAVLQKPVMTSLYD